MPRRLMMKMCALLTFLRFCSTAELEKTDQDPKTGYAGYPTSLESYGGQSIENFPSSESSASINPAEKSSVQKETSLKRPVEAETTDPILEEQYSSCNSSEESSSSFESSDVVSMTEVSAFDDKKGQTQNAPTDEETKNYQQKSPNKNKQISTTESLPAEENTQPEKVLKTPSFEETTQNVPIVEGETSEILTEEKDTIENPKKSPTKEESQKTDQKEIEIQEPPTTENEPQIKTEEETEIKPETLTENKVNTAMSTENAPEIKAEEIKTQEKTEIKPETLTENKVSTAMSTENAPEIKAEEETEEMKTQEKTEIKPETLTENKESMAMTTENASEIETEEIKTQEKTEIKPETLTEENIEEENPTEYLSQTKDSSSNIPTFKVDYPSDDEFKNIKKALNELKKDKRLNQLFVKTGFKIFLETFNEIYDELVNRLQISDYFKESLEHLLNKKVNNLKEAEIEMEKVKNILVKKFESSFPGFSLKKLAHYMDYNKKSVCEYNEKKHGDVKDFKSIGKYSNEQKTILEDEDVSSDSDSKTLIYESGDFETMRNVPQ